MSPKDKKKKRKKTMAEKADPLDLYLKSVQEPSVEVKFFQRAFKKEYGRQPALLREDFCGTAAICYQWVKKHPERRALGVDIDPVPLAWGLDNLTEKLTKEEVGRVKLMQEDVRHISEEKADVLAAQNFSFWIFKTRAALVEYFKAAHDNLAEQGVFVTDMMGGSEVYQDETEETTKKKGFTYVWEQAHFNPITSDAQFYIHFRFKDGSELTRAFEYDWRLWTIPEVVEAMTEAGFKRVDVYWEDEDEDGEGTGVFRVRKHASADAAWIAYVVGVK
ncbi:class I SAM-dependent methyltransferase [Planctomycetales bacterium ZRK34]|nr:class I SAM-dependent methyltransferase [Planctomycetales bacterium ZRK34]